MTLGVPMGLRPLYGECRRDGYTRFGALIYTALYRPTIWSRKLRGKYLHPGCIQWHCLDCDKRGWVPFGADGSHDCSAR